VLVDTGRRVFVPARRRRIGYVFQDSRLFPHLSVRSNLLYGRNQAPPAGRWARFDEIVGLLGIGQLLARRPRSLSGGERQRVAIGRALLASPRLLLMDEPLTAIDQSRRAEILPYLDRLKSELAIPIVYVSHSVEEIARIADTVVLLDAGRVAVVGAVSDVLSRVDLAPLAEIEPATILTGTAIAGAPAETAAIDHPGGRILVPGLAAAPGSVVRLRVRARDVALAVGDPGRISIRNRLPATVTAMMPGPPPSVDIHLAIGGETLVARVTREAVDDLDLRPGAAVTALVKAVAVEGLG
jgi:molybdate transport system ATP-binding protein